MKIMMLLLLFTLISCGGGGGSSDNSGSGNSNGNPVTNPTPIPTQTLDYLSNNFSGLSDSVPLAFHFQLNFSSSINGLSVVNNSILQGLNDTVIVRDSITGEKQLITVLVSGPTLNIHPDMELTGSREFTIEITTELLNEYGNHLDQNLSLRFTTEATEDITPGDAVALSWTQFHDLSSPVTHFILHYGGFSGMILNNDNSQSMNHDHVYEEQLIIRSESLNPNLEGTRLYGASLERDQLPGLYDGTYNYFNMNTCSGSSNCSIYSAKEASRYIE